MPTVYEVITNRIIEQLEQGVAPWQKPWSARGDAGLPHNFATKKAYRGINVWMLTCTGYPSPAFLTFKQAQDLGGTVRKGEKGYPVVFWKFGQNEDKSTGEIKDYAMCRYYTVFNIAQCDNIQIDLPAPSDVPEVPAIDCCESIVANWQGKPTIDHGSNRGAFYQPSCDRVSMPARDLFVNSEEYYSTLFHELTHSTGHKSRLNRSTITEMAPFGSCNYSREELIAEMGAAFLCGFAGIENKTIDNSASYIAGWLRKLRDDHKLVITAAQQAQKACDLILGHKFEQLEKAEGAGDALPVPAVLPVQVECVSQLGLF